MKALSATYLKYQEEQLKNQQHYQYTPIESVRTTYEQFIPSEYKSSGVLAATPASKTVIEEDGTRKSNIMDLHMRALAATYMNYANNEDKQ